MTGRTNVLHQTWIKVLGGVNTGSIAARCDYCGDASRIYPDTEAGRAKAVAELRSGPSCGVNDKRIAIENDKAQSDAELRVNCQ